MAKSKSAPVGLKGSMTKLWNKSMVGAKWLQLIGTKAFTGASSISWILATTTIIVIVPIMIEVQRENVVLEGESLQAEGLIAKGANPQELQDMGFNVQNPAVLNQK